MRELRKVYGESTNMMAENIPKGPFFIAPLNIENSGVDFLGLRQVNLDMMDNCLPGINNFTQYVRGFSVIAWIYWKFYALMEEAGIKQPSISQLEAFKEKVEILFTWGHHGLNLPRIPGIQSMPPLTGNEVGLKFSAWNRSVNNTSLMAAPNYGPASKNTGGLGFIAPVSGAFFKVCGNGIKLAEALDAQLLTREDYNILTSMDIFSGDENNAKDLFPAWDVRIPSPDEQKAFRNSFFDQHSISSKTKIGQRSATLGLVMRILGDSDIPLSESQLRIAMAYGKFPQCDYFPLSGPLKAANLNWLVLQLRQAQRLGMEGILSWTERRISSFNEVETDSMVKTAHAAIQAATGILPVGGNAEQIMNQLFNDIKELHDLINAAEKDPLYCFFWWRRRESNPRPKIFHTDIYMLVLISKFRL
jgi:hypothetical protein